MIYYIQNTIDYRNKKIQGYFGSLERAIEICKNNCSDFLKELGSGEIYEVPLGFNITPRLVWKDGKRISSQINY